MTIVALRPTPSRLAEPLDAPERYYQASPDRQLVADPARRRRTDFVSDGVRLAGHLYRPARAVDAQPTPAIVMCGPASSVKEQTLPHYAERFADAGYTVLTFDPRTFGESDGQPRCYYDPPRSSATTPTRSATCAPATMSIPTGSRWSGSVWAAGTRSPPPPGTSGSPPW
jgi:X-Pro dipeptidyl-peptidase (S15 family)